MSAMRAIVARCTITACVAMLSLATCTTALADPGNGNGNGGKPDDPPKQATSKKDPGPSEHANAKAADPGPSSDHANTNASKKVTTSAANEAGAASAPANSNANGNPNANAGANKDPADATVASSTNGPAAAGAPLAVESAPVGPAAQEQKASPGLAKAGSSDPPGNGGANSNDATLGRDLGPGNRGTGKIHNDATNPLDRRNQPKVGCFDVTGFHFDPNQSLAISIVGHGGPNAGTGSLGANTQSDGQGNLLLDSQSLPAGMYKLTIRTGRPGGVKHKVFKVTGTCAQPGPGPSGGPPTIRTVRVEGPVRPEVAPPKKLKPPKKLAPPARIAPPERIRVVVPQAPVIPGVAPPPAVPTLAFTGSNAADGALLGGTLLALGLITVLAARRRATV